MPKPEICFSWESAILLINKKAKAKEPFLVMVNFEKTEAYVIDIEQCAGQNIFFKTPLLSNFKPSFLNNKLNFELKKKPISFVEYEKAFKKVYQALHRGDSFLVNLTKANHIELNVSLNQVFENTQALYQVLFKDVFVSFSPEKFIQIDTKGLIASYPMKGTIDAQMPNAQEQILQNKKELAEHTTIVDLIRNDLSKVCQKVWVKKFRYIDKIKTQEGELLQVSSEINGQLEPGWTNKLGHILDSLLPAGSICGAPKPQTLTIIKQAEAYDRGYYTGIVGVFDGQSFDSGVMIRFIEQTQAGLVYKSGGGITFQSQAKAEYKEMIEKIYIPVHKN